MKKSSLNAVLTPVRHQRWSADTVPLLSIWCVTYNHQSYIKEAIESFLDQETTFPVEILIHDDASTDGTSEIIKKYSEEFPQVVKCIIQKNNLFSQGKQHLLWKYLLTLRSKYIAWCSGDDYWCDPTKLESQVNLLLNNPECSGCFHDVAIRSELQKTTETSAIFQNISTKSRLALADVISLFPPFHSSTIAYLRSDFPAEPPLELAKNMSGDLVLYTLLASKGDLLRIPKVMSVYRKHGGGITTQASHSDDFLLSLNRILMWRELCKKVWPMEMDKFNQVINYYIAKIIECFFESEEPIRLRAALLVKAFHPLDAIDKRSLFCCFCLTSVHRFYQSAVNHIRLQWVRGKHRVKHRVMQFRDRAFWGGNDLFWKTVRLFIKHK